MAKSAGNNLFKVFVYGTLKRGQPNNHWLARPENGFSRFISEGTTKEKYPLVVGTRYNIPFLLDKPGVGNNIEGEIYEIDSQMLAKLDILEDYPNYYDREVQPIICGDDTIDCWLYLIRNYPEKLLAKNHLTSYSNTAESPYWERCDRFTDIKAKDDMSY